jgi:hypothetical protein
MVILTSKLSLANRVSLPSAALAKCVIYFDSQMKVHGFFTLVNKIK